MADRMRLPHRFLFLLLTLLIPYIAVSAPIPREDIPPTLKPWVRWVLHDEEEKLCPPLYNNAESRECSWPSDIALNLNTKGGHFTQHVHAFHTLWIPLPGDTKHWPNDVNLDSQPAPVTQQNDRPGLVVPNGSHTLSGTFTWSDIPEHLSIPPSTGLIQLTLNNEHISSPSMDNEGRLWLRQQPTDDTKPTHIEMHVHRLISDAIPLTVTTHIDLNISGQGKEIVIPNTLLPDFTPVSLDSSLPARVDPDGKLRIQVQQGQWQISLTGRVMHSLKTLTLPKSADPLAANEEVWAFEAHNDLRLVTVDGLPAIDPQQTTLPQQWKHFPAYRILPGQTLKFNETKRGNPDPSPDQLTLHRNLWLDFDGHGFTIQDTIGGSLTRSWRLEMAAPQQLGHATVDNIDQYITQIAPGKEPGIELRRGMANIKADSRLNQGSGSFSATGWTHDFDHLSAQLHLPPGWRLFHASGVDKAPTSWIERWTLLDFFLVLIITLACGKLFGWRWALASLCALTLSYHEADTPRWVWLNLLAAVALLRIALPAGRIRTGIHLYKWFSVIAVVFVLIPFSITQIRQMFYPALEHPWKNSAGYEHIAARASLNELQPDLNEAKAIKDMIPEAPAPQIGVTQDMAVAAAPEQFSGDIRQEKSYSGGSIRNKTVRLAKSNQHPEPYGLIDPNAKIQTGPGLPSWQWNEYALTWSGPVQASQTIRLWLISPCLNALLTVIRLTLLVALLARLAELPCCHIPSVKKMGTLISLLVSILMLSGMLNPSTAHARKPAPDLPTAQPKQPNEAPLATTLPEQPGTEILEQLKTKLLAPPDCLPNCAEISRMKISTSPNSIQIRLEAHVETPSALPLPGSANQWLPERVLVNGQPATGLMRDKTGNVWIQLPRGVHQLLLESKLDQNNTLNIALPLKPHNIETTLSGWTLEGLGTNNEVGESLQLTRTQKQTGSSRPTGATDQLPPFIQVERTLSLGLTWQISTQITRISSSTAPVLVEIPLLAGESVTTADVTVQQGKTIINLGPQSTAFSFDSTLKDSPHITLKAPSYTNQIQRWKLNLSPQWHATLAGIPVITPATNNAEWLPEWQPWPGEEATITVTRPGGIDGQTLTLDRSVLQMNPGIRATDVTLALTLRSSRGGQHTFALPADAVLQKVIINGSVQPLQLEGQNLKLPITPGRQEISVSWRESRGITTLFSTSSVNVGLKGVNGEIQMSPPQDRWTLFLGGPRLGPAILFWGTIVTLVLVAIGLGRITLTPLKWYHWFLLGLGLTQIPLSTSVIVMSWPLILGIRQKFGQRCTSNWLFNCIQIALGLWTLITMICLFWAMQQGLLGSPDMQITGNGSNSWNLQWYQDRTEAQLPTAWVMSVPLLGYRLLMLGWALWLAYSLLSWLKWGWSVLNEGGCWQALKAENTPENEDNN